MTDSAARPHPFLPALARQPSTTTPPIAYEEDGGLLIARRQDRRRRRLCRRVAARPARASKRIDHRPHLLLPGFIDAHVHFPQMQMIASYGAELLDWLNKYTFPGGDEVPQRRSTAGASRGCSSTRWCGTARRRSPPIARCTRQSAEAFFAESHDRNMLNIAGKVMMDRNAPDGVLDTPQSRL